MIRLDYDYSQLSELEKKLGRFDAAYAAEIRSTMEATLSLVEQNVVSRTPVGVGTLSQSITSRIFGQPVNLAGEVGSSLIYAPVMEFGRRPGARMPPVEPIRTWLIRKGIMGPDQADKMAFVVARAIGRKGIRARRMFRDGWRVSRPKVLELWRKMPGRIIARLEL